MSTIPNCPECNSEYAYENGTLFACPDCGHEWSAEEAAAAAEAKGTSTTLKIGTKVKNIRITPGEDHDIDCKIDGIGPMKLKSQFVKKI